MAKTLLRWIRDITVKLVDPDHEARINDQAKALERELASQRDKFTLDASLAKIGVRSLDEDDVLSRTYERLLERAWKDQKISQKEQVTLSWVAKALQLNPKTVRDIDMACGLSVFEQCLATVLEDGIVDEHEAAMLRRIAKGIGIEINDLMMKYFAQEGEHFLRNMFASLTEDGNLTEDELDQIVRGTQSLGLTRAQLDKAIEPQAEQFVEHVLADAKADGVLSKDEEKTLEWLLGHLTLPRTFHWYVEGELKKLKILTAITNGHLPSVKVHDLLLKAGELVHFHGPASYKLVKNLKSGPKIEEYEGDVTITDARLIFASELKTFDVNHRRVIRLDKFLNGVEVRAGSKGSGIYRFQGEGHLAVPIYRIAIRKANQTVVEKKGGAPTRHIPREIRQRVWQRYGGRCAECTSGQYLEFDHVIPVAKGGSNSESNVQLLCRNCNLKKSDAI